ncbi:hypothetical protein BGV40_09690 [Methanosarcina sp. Ant1]|nr:hypothetical protein BGV40_09690 [Methanosarcina sp. Ant1]
MQEKYLLIEIEWVKKASTTVPTEKITSIKRQPCKLLLLNLQKSQVFKFSLNWGRTQARQIYFNLNKKHIELNFSGILFFKPLSS